MGRRLVAVVVVSAAVVGCGGHRSSSHADRRATATPAAPVIVGAGRLVGIGGGRTLYINCVGSGSPTVVLEAGFGGDNTDWAAVQPQLGRTTRTCAYDRAGLGSSLAIPGVHDASDEIDDLHRLLAHARIPAPYVLVGHSYGGLLARLFTHAHPHQAAGLVLVDAMGRDQDRRLLPIWQAQPPRVRRQLPRPTSKPVEDGVNIMAGERLDARVRALGDTPLAVITRGKPDTSAGSLPPSVRRPADRLWTTMQDELAALSRDHVHVIARHSGHFIQQEQPQVVIRAVQAVVRAARDHSQLPPCSQLFAGPAVRCLG